jgi:SAM-dependent methyltransferase
MQTRRLSAFVKSGKNFFKVPGTAFDYYQAQGAYEHAAYEKSSSICVLNGRIQKLSHKESRALYCDYIFEEIDRLLSGREHISVLEVGCGNCINLDLIRKRYGKRVELHGLDFSGNRISAAHSYFRDALNDISFSVQSITDPVPDSESGRYDLVFSMHCLEQIPFAVIPAIEGMYKRAKSTVVFIEPVFEFARPSQKLFLIYSDFNRTLLSSIHYLGYKTTRCEPLKIESSLGNQSSIIVVQK